MDRERWKEIDAVFERMLDIEPEDRANALAQMCAGDDDLRRKVEALLDQEEAAEDFLKSSAIAGLAGQVAEMIVAGLGSLAPGARISHYRIESRIGAGGMGEVWKARDEHLCRDVAIKILPPEFSDDPGWVRHFEQEAHTISALNHPNIITIYDFGRSDGLHFIVTELIEGKTLRAYFNDSRVGWRESVLIATQIASALNAAHSVGIIHRDIKPENIMVLDNRRVKMLDFGIAKRVNAPVVAGGNQSAAGILTRSGSRPGTLKYMSPEQARGEPLDSHTDVFSLGLALYEMITGRHPFAGESDEEIIEALKSEDDTSVNAIGVIRLWDIENHRYQETPNLGTLDKEKNESYKALAFSPDLRWATSPDFVWERASGRVVCDYSAITDGREWVSAAAFSRDGQRLAVVANHGETLLLETGTWRVLARRKTPGLEANRVSFSPDGKSLAIGHWDGPALERQSAAPGRAAWPA